MHHPLYFKIASDNINVTVGIQIADRCTAAFIGIGAKPKGALDGKITRAIIQRNGAFLVAVDRHNIQITIAVVISRHHIAGIICAGAKMP